MAKYLVTGGAGFVGTHLVKLLEKEGHLAVVLDDLSTGKLSTLPTKNTRFFQGSILDNDILEELFQEIDGCFHLAAIASVQKSINDWLYSHQVNLSGTIKVFLQASKRNVPVVYASSAAVYGKADKLPLTENFPPNPLSPYAVDKYACELQAKIFGNINSLKSCGLRFFNVYGPQQLKDSDYSGVISILKQQLEEGKELSIFGDGMQTRDFVHVADVVSRSYSINDLAQIINKIFPIKGIKYLPPQAGSIKHSVGLVIYDNVLIDHANFELEKKLEKEQAAELTVSWIGNSSWGEWYNGYSDYKGLNSIIKPAFKQLAAEKIKIKKCIIDKNDRIRSRQEIWEILKKTDVLLIASIEEGTPLTLIEAMSFGCAIISTNVGIVSEILPEIQKKFIINRDPIKFATAIKHLANQRKLLSALQKQNVLMYQKIFGNDFAPKQLWVSFIQDAINNSVLETVVKAKQQVLKNLAFMHDKNCFVMKKLLKNIIHLPFIKKPIKYLLEYSWIRESVKKIISTFLFSTVSKHYDIKKFILRYQDQPTTDNEDVHVIYSGAFPGVANSTKLLFNKIIPFPAESLSILSVIYMMLPRKTAATIAKLIIDSKIKNLVISGGLDIHIQLVEQLYRLKGTKDLAIYLLWHGSPAQWVDSWHCYDFYKWFLLYQQNKIQGIITLKKGLEEFLKANSIRSYLLQNFIPDFGKLSYKSVKSFSLREKFSIGLWSVSAVWIKNLYPQIAALTMFKESLNPPQLAASLHSEGPLLILAGAGTGKTKVLTTRVANIIHKNLSLPRNILAVTFTNKAAKEMQDRIKQMIDCYGLNIGDDDQSIYGWRGAEIGNILRFEKDFTNATIIKLEQNYRSSSEILLAASKIINNNKARHKKMLWTNKNNGHNGQKIKIVSCWNEKEEGRFVVSEINRLVTESKYSASNIAILVRASFQTRAFEEAFINNALPYKIIGGLKFYERMEIRDLLAYIRIALNHSDNLAFERIINNPKRAIGNITLKQIKDYAVENNLAIFHAITAMLEQNIFKNKVRDNLNKLIVNINNWHQRYLVDSAFNVTKSLLEESGYLIMLKEEKTDEAMSRIENINEMLKVIGESPSIHEFIEHSSLVMENEELETNFGGSVSIMTLHAAKGLEFDLVFLPGWEEGVFPHQRSLNEEGEKDDGYYSDSSISEEIHLMSIEEKLCGFINKNKVPADKINEFLERKENDSHAIIQGGKIKLNNEEATYILQLYHRQLSQYSPDSHAFYKEFITDINNIWLAHKLSAYVRDYFEFDTEKIENIFSNIDYRDDGIGNIQILPAQIEQITGQQWQNLRQENIEEFDQEFALEVVVQDKLKKLELNELLASNLSSFINTTLKNNENKVADILEMTLFRGEEEGEYGEVNISAAQVENITGEQWQKLRELTDDSVADFNRLFGGEPIVQDKISELGATYAVDASEAELEFHRKRRESLNATIINDMLAVLPEVQRSEVSSRKSPAIKDQLGKILNALDEDYLNFHREDLIEKIASGIMQKEKLTIWQPMRLVRAIFYGRDLVINNSKQLDKYIATTTSSLTHESDKLAARDFEKKIQDYELTNAGLLAKLNQFLVATNQKIDGGSRINREKIKGLTTEQLINIRKFNPTKFDRLLFPSQELLTVRAVRDIEERNFAEDFKTYKEKGEATKNSTFWSTIIIQESRNKAKAPYKVGIKRRDKTLKKLHDFLSSLDSQYLRNNKNGLVEEIAKHMSEQKLEIFEYDKDTGTLLKEISAEKLKLLTLNSKEKLEDKYMFIISPASIRDVTKAIETKHTEKNKEFLKQMLENEALVQDSLIRDVHTRKIKDVELDKRIYRFLSSENIETLVTAKIKNIGVIQEMWLQFTDRNVEAINNKKWIEVAREIQLVSELKKSLQQPVREELQKILNNDEYHLNTTQKTKLINSLDIFNEQSLKNQLKDTNFYLTSDQQLQINNDINHFINERIKKQRSAEKKFHPLIFNNEQQVKRKLAQLKEINPDAFRSIILPSSEPIKVLAEELRKMREVREKSFVVGEAREIGDMFINPNLDSPTAEPEVAAATVDNKGISSQAINALSSTTYARTSVSTDSIDSKDGDDSGIETDRGSLASSSISLESDLGLMQEEPKKFKSNLHDEEVDSIKTFNSQTSDEGYGTSVDSSSTQEEKILPPLQNDKEGNSTLQTQLTDISQLALRLYTYNVNVAQFQGVSSKKRAWTLFESTMSVLEGLGGQLLRDNLSDEKLDRLLSEIKVANKMLKTDNDGEATLDYQLAKLEAKLKGFTLVEEQGDEVILPIFKKILLEMEGKSIPKAEYADTIIAKARESWVKNAENNFSPEQQVFEENKIVKEIIAQTEKTKKEMQKNLNRFTDTELEMLSATASKTIDIFIEELPYTARGELSPEIEKFAKMFIVEANIPQHITEKPEIINKLLPLIEMPHELMAELFTNIHIRRHSEYKEIREAAKNFNVEKASTDDIKELANIINKTVEAQLDGLDEVVGKNIINAALPRINKKNKLARKERVYEKLLPILTPLKFKVLKRDEVKKDIINIIRTTIDQRNSSSLETSVSNSLYDIWNQVEAKYGEKDTVNAKNIANNIMTNLLEKHPLLIDLSHQKEIRNSLLSVLLGKDEQYLADHSKYLIKSITKALVNVTKKTGLVRSKSNFAVKSKKVEEIANESLKQLQDNSFKIEVPLSVGQQAKKIVGGGNKFSLFNKAKEVVNITPSSPHTPIASTKIVDSSHSK
ncbi:putative DNA helicase II like [Pseudolycoriella hygida]|uniref:DNA 3'-5' helicase n=1 Tax=Pseudolycoriella hygida TaxID=35572 RepID=A0A9Q0S465_9DIPT|nr:putative DNA helicase II like [Pseudolycoriella hygida]